MRFLGIGDECRLGALYMRLRADGHEVKVFVSNPLCHGTMAGIIERVDDWRTELGWLGKDGIIVFEYVGEGMGATQNELRAQGYRVIGGSTYGDRLENDRGFGQRVLASIGMKICETHEFATAEEGIAFIECHPARYVLKYNGARSIYNYVGCISDGRDVKVLLKMFPPDQNRFILTGFIDGVEMGVGAYFNGREFVRPACLDWEHKRFFPHNLGELTGEMGTIVTYEGTDRFFELTLYRMEPLLRQNGYCGYINLNTIVNEHGIWPLEFTCRFGYPGYAVLEPLQMTSWAELLDAMVSGRSLNFETAPGFSAGIVLTTPPFPYDRSNVPEPIGLPVLFDGFSVEDRRNLHYGEVGLDNGQLVTSGVAGYTMVVTGIGSNVARARDAANRLAERITVPNLRYRRDIGDRLVVGELASLEQLGFFGVRDDTPRLLETV